MHQLGIGAPVPDGKARAAAGGRFWSGAPARPWQRWIFERLVFAFGDAQEDDLRFFSQIVAGGAYQVADILDEQKVNFFERPALESTLDPSAIQMAHTAGCDLLHGEAKDGETPGIILSLQVPRFHA